MDFGLVKDRGRATLTGEGKIVGTPSYLSVESVAVIRDIPEGRAADEYADLHQVAIRYGLGPVR